MKTVETIINPKKRVGEESPGKIYSDKLKVRARREWRGVKDTFYDYWYGLLRCCHHRGTPQCEVHSHHQCRCE